MSPEPDALPFVSPGMIWDGVTEYQNVVPPGAPGFWLIRMYGDGTRRFSQSAGTHLPMTYLHRFTELGWDSIGIAIENPHAGSNVWYTNDGFLTYGGGMSWDAVNQHFILNPFREHAARFAHQLDAAMGHHSLSSASEEDRLTVHRTLSAMIGSGWRRFQAWNAIDPEEMIVGGNFDGTPLWKRDEADYIEIDRLLCGQCDGATFARRFLFHADLPAFRRAYRSGLINSADRSTTPWSPTLFDVATQPESDFYDQDEAQYQAALKFYDDVIGVQDHA